MKLPNIDRVSNGFSNFMKEHKNLFDSTIIKGISLMIVWICALMPVWFYLVVRWLIEPADFWQEFAIFCVMTICIGWIQVGLVFIGFVFSMIIITEDF
jgi:hypothetical protein